VPEELLALFGEEMGADEGVRSIVGCPGTTREATVSRLAALERERGAEEPSVG
jgi:hypothetical protein